MSTRAALYFFLPVICYYLLSACYVEKWKLPFFNCVTGYIHGYSCLVEYRYTRREDLIVSLTIFACSIVGGYLCSVFTENATSVLLYISDIQACLYVAGVYIHVLIYTVYNQNVVHSHIVRLHKQNETFKAMMARLRFNQARGTASIISNRSAWEASCQNRRVDINHFVEAILKHQREHYGDIELYWNASLESDFFDYLKYIKHTKHNLEIESVFSSVLNSMFLLYILFLTHPDHFEDVFIWLSPLIFLFLAQRLDVLLNLCTIEINACKLLVSLSILWLWSSQNDLRNESIAALFVACDFFRSVANLISLPYMPNDCQRYAADLRWGQFTSLLGAYLTAVIIKINEEQLFALAILFYYGGTLLHILEVKLFSRVYLRYNIALFVVCLALFLGLYNNVLLSLDTFLGLYNNVLLSLDTFYVALFIIICEIYRAFHYSLLKILAAFTQEVVFSVRVFYSMVIKQNFLHSIGFAIMQLLYISCYLLCCLFIWQIIRSDACMQVFQTELIHVNITSDIECKILPEGQDVPYDKYWSRNNKTCRAVLYSNVILQCEFNVDAANRYVGEIHWKFDRSYASSGNKYLVEGHRVNDSLLVSHLTIYDITRFDYGKYLCLINYTRTNSNVGIDESCPNQSTYIGRIKGTCHTHEVLIGTIQLLKYKTRNKIIDAPLGSRVRISLKQQDIYKHNQTCRNATSLKLLTMHNDTIDASAQSCLPLMSFYKWVSGAYGNSDVFSVGNFSSLELCIHPTTIGEFHIGYLVQRKPHNFVFVKAMHLVILPRSRFEYDRTYNRLYDQLALKQTTGTQILEVDWEKMQISAEAFYNIQFLIEGIILLFMIIFSFVLLVLLLKISSYFNYYCHNLMLCVLGHSFDRSLLHTHKFGFNKLNDVFVSFSDDCEHGRAFVHTKFIHYLKYDAGLSVTSQDDVSHGELLYHTLSETMASCRKVVIVWSAEYGGDRVAFIELQMFLFPLFEENIFSRNDIFIIKYDDTPIPVSVSLLGDVIEWNYDFDTEEGKLRKLSKKIQQSIDEGESLVNKIKRLANKIKRWITDFLFVRR